MFEDSTFESTGRIRTRSRGWMIATTFINGSILLALILIPLIHPEALPRQQMTRLFQAPPPPPPPQQPTPRPPAHAAAGPVIASPDQFTAPTRIPPTISIVTDPGPPPSPDRGLPDSGLGTPSGIGDVLRGQPGPSIVHAAPSGPVRISSGVASSILIYKVLPIYPPIAKVAGVQGTVSLSATISKQGTIENLRVVSGPPMLQKAALDAVSAWRYRPFLLNGEPVAVETTVNVVFNLGR